tara:strand:- start:308 stop:433 length:126 start_codon:yes stop_codon:yes gene_type:complete
MTQATENVIRLLNEANDLMEFEKKQLAILLIKQTLNKLSKV